MLVASEQNATSAKRADMRLYWQRALARRSMKGARLCHGASVGVVAKLACLLVPKNCARICRRRTPPAAPANGPPSFRSTPIAAGAAPSRIVSWGGNEVPQQEFRSYSDALFLFVRTTAACGGSCIERMSVGFPDGSVTTALCWVEAWPNERDRARLAPQ